MQSFGASGRGLINQGVFSKDLVLATQLRKTMLSIYSNFGEGFERDGNREFIQFLSISKGSVGELRAQLLYAFDLGYLEQESFEELSGLAKHAARCLGGLLRHLKSSEFRGHKYNRNKSVRNALKCASKGSNPEPQPEAGKRAT
ncbi:MAG TPA: four helix bundle protein [Chthoniobacterales bacterium]|jgi:four helix bundle protein|nr:four helix bundle protein [Chthoniobacterales bacterium]